MRSAETLWAVEKSRKSINEVIAENLAACMAQHKSLRTQAALAKESGLAQTTVSIYLDPARRKRSKSGKEPSAKVAELARMAEALGVQPWTLLREMSERERRYYRRTEEAYLELVGSDPNGISGNTESGPL